MSILTKWADLAITEANMFHRIEKPRSPAPHVHAAILIVEILDTVSPFLFCDGNRLYITTIAELEHKATDEQIKELIRCGAQHDQQGVFLCI